VSFDSIAVEREAPVAFVVMQFGGYETIYADVIRPIKDPGVDIKRVDELLHPGSIIAAIEHGIAESDLVIAEITEANANVFYEVGYAYALEKPVLLLARRGRELPFALLVQRCYFYGSDPDGLAIAASELRKRVEEGLARGEQPEQ
jgi:hypothetical protein